MKLSLVLSAICLSANIALASVQVFVQESNGVALIKYQCSAGEVVRAFALDISVDQGVIFGVSDFFKGVSKTGSTGYGIFPSSLRDHATIISGTNIVYDPQYSPIANVADAPAGTLPGLNSAGVTLEFAALWDPNLPAARPPASGTLCALHLSRSALVAVGPNLTRGGVLASPPDVVLTTTFASAFVDADAVITSVTATNGTIRITFKGGELETAPVLSGPWSGTGNTNGILIEPIGAGPKFYRVHHR